MKKTVTVAIPVYNGERYIPDALQSIILQTREVDHILVCDNQSTDNTVSIVKKFIKDYPEKSIQLHQNKKNIGVHNNFNKCMELCSTDYLLILGSDDKLKTDAIKKLAGFLNENPEYGLVGGHVDFIDEYGKLMGETSEKNTLLFKKGQILEYIEKTNLFIQHSTVMLHMQHTRKVGYWDVRFIGCDERYYAAVLRQFPIARLGNSLVYQRLHKEQGVRDENKRFNDRLKHFTENLKVADYEINETRRKKSRSLIKKWISDYCRSISKLEMQDKKNISLGIRYWLYGFCHHPSYFAYVYLRKAKHGFQKLIGAR